MINKLDQIANEAIEAFNKTSRPVTETLAERGKNYGAYKHDAAICMGLIDVMQAQPTWNKLPPYMKHALTLFAVKIARILGGKADYADNWHDIAGYATLVEREITSE